MSGTLVVHHKCRYHFFLSVSFASVEKFIHPVHVVQQLRGGIWLTSEDCIHVYMVIIYKLNI